MIALDAAASVVIPSWEYHSSPAAGTHFTSVVVLGMRIVSCAICAKPSAVIEDPCATALTGTFPTLMIPCVADWDAKDITDTQAAIPRTLDAFAFRYVYPGTVGEPNAMVEAVAAVSGSAVAIDPHPGLKMK
jgi:hypothetical protein